MSGPELFPVAAHLKQILATVAPLVPLELPLAEAHGAVLAADVTSAIALPPFDNSAMDGYAVRLADVAGASQGDPVVLPVVADIPAGSDAAVRLQPGLSVRIMTGAPVPPGAEAVIPVEWTDGGVATVAVFRSPVEGAHIRRSGEDVTAGQVVLRAGVRLGPAQVGLLSAVGQPRVLVHPRPRVVLLATGDELAEPGSPLRRGQIYESNSHMLTAACREAGAQPYRVGIVPDEPARLTEVLEDQLVRADVIITSGGVSVGAYDVVKAVLSRIGTVDFRKVAMQPGMPQGFGTLGPDSTPLFALPGNPVSAMVSFEVFVRPALRRMLGAASLHRPQVSAQLATDARSPAGRTQYVRAQVQRGADGAYRATPVGGSGSHLLAALAAANALLVIDADRTEVHAGESLPAMLLDQEAQ